MKRIHLLLLTFTLLSVSSIAQTINLFDWAQDSAIVKSEFITYDDSYIKVSASVTIRTYKEYKIYSPNNKYSYTLRLNGTKDSIEQYKVYDAFSIVDSTGKTILFRWGRDPLYDVRYLTTNPANRNYFIQVPLDDEGFALIFGGWLFQYDSDAGEMVIVVVRKDKATVVYDNDAYAYKYAAPPNFSMEFVDNVNGLLDNSGQSQITDAALKPHTKHKIWREGNVLKYNTWK